MSEMVGARRQVPTSVAASERWPTIDEGMTWSTAAMSSRDVLPAGLVYWTVAQRPPWFDAVGERLMQLAARPDGWDSYGAAALQLEVVDRLKTVLLAFDAWIQSAPVLSLTDTGGLVASWSSVEGVLELRLDPGEPAFVLRSDPVTGAEWEGPAAQATAFDKWLWQASAAS